MKFTGSFLYRVRVVSYPEGSHQDVDYGGELWSEPVPGWRPPGWRPTGNYTQMHGTEEFVWPTTNDVWASRTSAKKRADLFESFGATAVVERSSQIVWPRAEGRQAA